MLRGAKDIKLIKDVKRSRVPSPRPTLTPPGALRGGAADLRAQAGRRSSRSRCSARGAPSRVSLRGNVRSECQRSRCARSSDNSERSRSIDCDCRSRSGPGDAWVDLRNFRTRLPEAWKLRSGIELPLPAVPRALPPRSARAPSTQGARRRPSAASAGRAARRDAVGSSWSLHHKGFNPSRAGQGLRRSLRGVAGSGRIPVAVARKGRGHRKRLAAFAIDDLTAEQEEELVQRIGMRSIPSRSPRRARPSSSDWRGRHPDGPGPRSP